MLIGDVIMETHFYIVRHGVTIFNEKKLCQGWCDSPLTEEGVLEAKKLGEKLSEVNFNFAVSSTSERAMDTMHYILEKQRTKVPYAYEKGLKEIYFGTFEGECWLYKDVTLNQIWDGYVFCGGESRDKAQERFVYTLRRYGKEGNVLIVSHGDIIGRFVQTLDDEIHNKKKHPSLLVPNCSLTKVDYIDGLFLLKAYPSVVV